jgi:predicted dehydrogenase
VTGSWLYIQRGAGEEYSLLRCRRCGRSVKQAHASAYYGNVSDGGVGCLDCIRHLGGEVLEEGVFAEKEPA